MRILLAALACFNLASSCALQTATPGGGARALVIGVGVLETPAPAAGDVRAGRRMVLGVDLRLDHDAGRGPGLSIGYAEQAFLVAPLGAGDGVMELRRGPDGALRLERLDLVEGGGE